MEFCFRKERIPVLIIPTLYLKANFNRSIYRGMCIGKTFPRKSNAE